MFKKWQLIQNFLFDCTNIKSFYTSFSITHFAGTLCPGLRRMMSSLTNKGTGTLVFIPSLIVHCREMHGDIGEFMNGKSSAHQSDLDKTSLFKKCTGNQIRSLEFIIIKYQKNYLRKKLLHLNSFEL